ncbi:hypothetical protein [uncultured Sphingomonas sp.]|uniref:hypothetical protein n=1 Tax=uncultured Sphingomonas sp. TaxID=158754 RepID=UPI0035CB3116
MIEVTFFEGKQFDSADEIDTFQMPAVPRIGEIITRPVEQNFRVTEIEYRIGLDGQVAVRALITNERKSYTYNVDTLID